MIYATAFYAGLKPEPLLKVSEWADEYRKLSKTASSEAGTWRTKNPNYGLANEESAGNRRLFGF